MSKIIWKRYSIFSHIHTTKIKIAIAKIIYRLIAPFLKSTKMEITRHGIRYQVDLTEGIDLSLFIFGSFQKYILQNKLFSLPKNAIVFDVGANFGTMTLQLAKSASSGRIYAFEPTNYAFKRLKANVKLNPDLKSRINLIQAFVSGKTEKNPKIKAFSSWKVDGMKANETHPIHLGISKAAKKIGAIRLDDFCRREGITRLDFIKIDTDGHEHEVLKGAEKIISEYKPTIIFEVGDYILKEKNIDFLYFLDYFEKHNYLLFDTKSELKITRQNYHVFIPKYSTIDVAALPRKQRPHKLI